MRVCGYTIVCGSVRAIVCVCEQERERKKERLIYVCIFVRDSLSRLFFACA